MNQWFISLSNMSRVGTGSKRCLCYFAVFPFPLDSSSLWWGWYIQQSPMHHVSYCIKKYSFYSFSQLNGPWGCHTRVCVFFFILQLRNAGGAVKAKTFHSLFIENDDSSACGSFSFDVRKIMTRIHISLYQAESFLFSQRQRWCDSEDIMFYVTYGNTEQWTLNLQPRRFSKVRSCGASINWGVRLCHPCHSPGFISRKSGKGDDIPASVKDPDGSREQTKSPSHKWDVTWHCSGWCLTLVCEIASPDICCYPDNGEFCSSKVQEWVKTCLWKWKQQTLLEPSTPLGVSQWTMLSPLLLMLTCSLT